MTLVSTSLAPAATDATATAPVEAAPRPTPGQLVRAGLGAAIAVGAIAGLGAATHLPLLVAPMASSAILVFGAPDSPLAQPRAVIGGHLLTSLIGLALLALLGAEPWAIATGVGVAMVAMLATRTLHAPAGANPLLIMVTGADWTYLFAPILLGTIVVVACGVMVNNLRGRRWPARWL